MNRWSRWAQYKQEGFQIDDRFMLVCFGSAALSLFGSLIRAREGGGLIWGKQQALPVHVSRRFTGIAQVSIAMFDHEADLSACLEYCKLCMK